MGTQAKWVGPESPARLTVDAVLVLLTSCTQTCFSVK